MSDWRAMVAAGRFEEAEPIMLAEAATPDGYGGETEMMGEFYEAWGDAIRDPAAATRKYWDSHNHFALYASWSTSGGEGTARMLAVNRVLRKIAALKEKGDAD